MADETTRNVRAEELLERRRHREDHAYCVPEDCFTAKIRYIRENGGLAAHFKDGHGPDN